MICSASMTFTSSHSPRPGLHTECVISDPPIVCMQDIIDHEYALVESIPDEDRAALMPIIRFVKNTIQEPFTSLPQLSYGRTVDAHKLTNETRMRLFNNQCHSTNYRGLEEMGFQGKKELQCPLFEDAVGERSALMPRTYALNETCSNHNLESCQVSMPWQRIAYRHSSEGLHQQFNYHGALHNDIDTFDSLLWGDPCLPLSKHENQTGQVHQLRGGFVFSSSKYAGVCQPNTRTSFNRDPKSNVDKVCSSLDMDSFNLEELRRSLRPPKHEMDSDRNDIKSGDASNFRGGVDDEDDDMDEDDGNNDSSYILYADQDEEQDALDVEWPLYWGNGKNYHPTFCGSDRLQFPRVHCRKRHIIKKAVGWIKKRAAESLVSRVRHKRKCNLPCCTNCETGTKRRKASGYGSRKCARLSTMKKIAASSLPATTSENATKSNRQLSKARSVHLLASSESCDEKEASQVTQDLDTSSLATVLTTVLTNSKGRGLTSCEALQALVQAGYLNAVGYEGQALASRVKTTLKECPQFKELKNHRFVLNSGAGHKVAIGIHHCRAAKDAKLSVRALSLSQITCSQDLTKKVDPSPNGTPCETPHQRGLRCLRSKGRRWQCSHTQHQQHPPTTATSGCSSCEIVDSCDASNEAQHEAKLGEEMLATFVDSCSGQSAAEHNLGQVEPIRCCRTDGKNWQCSNQAQKGSIYCERHQSRCKKGMVKQALLCLSQEKKKKLQTNEPTGQNRRVSHERQLSMQLRPRRRKAALDICLN